METLAKLDRSASDHRHLHLRNNEMGNRSTRGNYPNLEARQPAAVNRKSSLYATLTDLQLLFSFDDLSKCEYGHVGRSDGRREKMATIGRGVVQDSLYNQPWYFGCTSRVQAVQLLMLNGNGDGSFCIRNAQSSGHAYSLSGNTKLEIISCMYIAILKSLLSSTNPVRWDTEVKHYRILGTGGCYYIAKRATFPTVQQLVEHYRKHEDGLYAKINQPCIPFHRPAPLPVNRSVDLLETWSKIPLHLKKQSDRVAISMIVSRAIKNSMAIYN